jgi:hypothetical protein
MEGHAKRFRLRGYGARLTLSDLEMTLKRATKIAQSHSDCVIRIVSFGPFGLELTAAWAGEGPSGTKVATKLKRMGLGSSEIELLFSRLVLCEEREQDITEKIQRFPGSIPLLDGEASHASDMLCQWLDKAAERSERITHADLIKRLTHVGRYLNARSGYWRDWASVIEPLDPDSTPSLPSERLRGQFQQGMSTRYEHILANWDIQRHPWLEQISAGFEKTNVVIAHGASSQGKSASLIAGCTLKRRPRGACRSSSSRTGGRHCRSPQPCPRTPKRLAHPSPSMSTFAPGIRAGPCYVTQWRMHAARVEPDPERDGQSAA